MRDNPIHSVCVYVCACQFNPVCLRCKLRFNLLGDLSMQCGQYQLLPQSQMEADWGGAARQTSAAQSPNIIIRLREAITPSLGRLQPEHKPTAFRSVHVNLSSSLVRQHDRWFGLEAAMWTHPGVHHLENPLIHLYVTAYCECVLQPRDKREEFSQVWLQALMSDCNSSAWTQAASVPRRNRWRYRLAEQDSGESHLQPVAPGEEWD